MPDLTLFSSETAATEPTGPDGITGAGRQAAVVGVATGAAGAAGVAVDGPEPVTRTASGPAGSAAPGETAARAVELLDGLVAALRSLGGEWLEERLGLVGRCEARLAAVKSDTVTALARRDGEAMAAEAVRDRLKQSRGAAKRDVKLAGQLAEVPRTAGALADGAITPRHARMIAEAAEQTDVDEPELLAAAQRQPADTFGHTLRDHVNERTAGEDLEAQRRRQRARREVSITKQPDGMYKLFGLFDPVAGSRVETALAAAARKLRRAEDPSNRATAPQRLADALELLVTRHGSAKNPNTTLSTTLLVVADYDIVAGQLAGARLADGTPLAAGELVELALDAKILPALFDTAGQPLWLGRQYRDANDAQRIALAARDRGCVGCGAANSFCQPHHITHWENGGPTDLDNLCLLCSHCHHTQVHELGADVVQGPDGRLALHPPTAKPNKPSSHRANQHAHRPDATGTVATVNYPLRR